MDEVVKTIGQIAIVKPHLKRGSAFVVTVVSDHVNGQAANPAIGIALERAIVAFTIVQFTSLLADGDNNKRSLIRLTRTKLAFAVHLISFVS